jgi:hypothetical protein
MTMSERMRCFGENILISLMVWVHNAAALGGTPCAEGGRRSFSHDGCSNNAMGAASAASERRVDKSSRSCE